MTNELIKDFYDAQFAAWPEVRARYGALARVEQRRIDFGDFPVMILHNPERARSTEAKVDKESISKRPCFLCAKNRPAEQIADPSLPGWEILVNPYPIFPVHFTIAATEHKPQEEMPLEMVAFVDAFPLLTAFYNGAKAGASAPDHLHFQATLREEIPLLDYVEKRHTPQQGRALTSTQISPDLPFTFISLLVTPDMEGVQTLQLLPTLCRPETGLFNTFVWKDDAGYLRILVFPRKAHRPECFHKEGDEALRISPGAVDMAGVIIAPRHEDFLRLNKENVAKIYDDVCLSLND